MSIRSFNKVLWENIYKLDGIARTSIASVAGELAAVVKSWVVHATDYRASAILPLSPTTGLIATQIYNPLADDPRSIQPV